MLTLINLPHSHEYTISYSEGYSFIHSVCLNEKLERGMFFAILI